MTSAGLVYLLLCAGTWIALVGWDAPDLLVGGLVVCAAWLLIRHAGPCRAVRRAQLAAGAAGGRTVLGRPLLILRLCGYLVTRVAPTLLLDTARLLSLILVGRPTYKPALVAVPLRNATEESMLLLSWCITLTPCQQVVAFDQQQRVLFVHVLDGAEPEAVSRQLADDHDRFFTLNAAEEDEVEPAAGRGRSR